MINAALAEYIRTLVHLNSPFDQMIRGEIPPDPEVVAGYDLFMGEATCGTCHFPPVFNGLVPPYYIENESEIIGVPEDDGVPRLSTDLGRYNHIKSDFYKHSFKTSTVRNSALTMPYMHNGSFDALIAVMEFYNQGGGAWARLPRPQPDAAPRAPRAQLRRANAGRQVHGGAHRHRPHHRAARQPAGFSGTDRPQQAGDWGGVLRGVEVLFGTPVLLSKVFGVEALSRLFRGCRAGLRNYITTVS